MHTCDSCGLEHDEPVVVAADPSPALVEETVAADVEIAKIEADRDIKVAKIGAGVAETEVESRLSELEGQIRGMREVLERVAPVAEPAPEPDPVVIAQDIAPEPEPEMPPREEHNEPRPAPKKTGFF